MDTTPPAYHLAYRQAIPAFVDRVNRGYRDNEARGWTTETDIVEGNRIPQVQVEGLLTVPDSAMLAIQLHTTVHGCVHLQFQGAEAYLGILTGYPRLQDRDLGEGLLQLSDRHAQAAMEGMWSR